MRIDRQQAIEIAMRFLEQHGCRVVPSVQDQPWAEGQRLVEFDECHFVTMGRPHWSVIFTKQLHPLVLYEHPEGPIVLVDAETGAAEFFAAL